MGVGIVTMSVHSCIHEPEKLTHESQPGIDEARSGGANLLPDGITSHGSGNEA
jgi:hypothetical protein